MWVELNHTDEFTEFEIEIIKISADISNLKRYLSNKGRNTSIIEVTKYRGIYLTHHF